jgi:hypothetical protein
MLILFRKYHIPSYSRENWQHDEISSNLWENQYESYTTILKLEAVNPSETLVPTYYLHVVMYRKIRHLHQDRCENTKCKAARMASLDTTGDSERTLSEHAVGKFALAGIPIS